MIVLIAGKFDILLYEFYFKGCNFMTYLENGSIKDIKIGFIGGGSRYWAQDFMRDLAKADNIGGTVLLYDIDRQAAKDNETIGNGLRKHYPYADNFDYKAVDTYEEALSNVDAVVISILPGTFDEMEIDVHTGEEYGIYQSVGDTTGIGGVIRALRTLPMFFEFGEQIKKYCPDAFVINYTNPMALCTGALYKVFPEIKCFGCCHEVFSSQKLLVRILEEKLGLKDIKREDIKINVLGVNHFTWITEAYYKNINLFPLYREYCLEHIETGVPTIGESNNLNKYFVTKEKVKMDLFLRFGYMAAAGDRHLAEFCPREWYLKDEQTVEDYGFALTPVSWRKENLKYRLKLRDKLVSGEETFKMYDTGEEGVRQLSAIFGLDDFVTNVNLPNRGQIPNLPLGAIVETNARFCSGSVTPVFAGNIPKELKALIDKTVDIQELIIEAAFERDLDKAFIAFISEQQNILGLKQSRELFDKMIEGTKNYLKDYFK